MLKEITDCLERGETVKLSSFGSFVVRKKGQRIGSNPKTGKEVPISPRRVMVFKPSAILKQRINSDPDGGELNGSNRQRGVGALEKAPDAFRTISEVAEEIDVPQHVLRFWESRFTQIKPIKRGGGRRYYRPDDVDLLRGVRHLLYGEGYTIRGVQRILREEGCPSFRTSGAPAPNCRRRQIDEDDEDAADDQASPRAGQEPSFLGSDRASMTVRRRSAGAARTDLVPPAEPAPRARLGADSEDRRKLQTVLTILSPAEA